MSVRPPRRRRFNLAFWRTTFAHFRWSSLIAFASLIGCSLGVPPALTATPAPGANAWDTLAPGLETRVYAPGGRYPLTTLLAVRIDPALFTFRAHYQPGAPRTLTGWQADLPDAAVIVNANFFSPENTILGLLVADGVAYGQAFRDRGGLFTVIGDAVRVRSLLAEPYYGEYLDQAVSAFPMLVANRAAAFTDPRPDRPSRRTVIGQDGAGRIVILVTPTLTGMALVDLSAYLAASDLDLVDAVNLDGGGSTLLALSLPRRDAVRVPSFDAVPAVLAVYPRDPG